LTVPSLLPEEEFEDTYTRKFEALLQGRGLLLNYDRDRAGIDRSLQLTKPGSLELSNTRIWFQIKGKHQSSLAAEQYGLTTEIAVPDITLDLARFWYASPEAVYLVVYVESVDLFVAEDVRDVIDRQWGPKFLAAGTFGAKQRTVTLKVRADAELTAERLDRFNDHRSMRIDGPSFRGRPLGHRFDPLRCELDAFEADDYFAVVRSLLEAYEFHQEQELEPGTLLELNDADRARLVVGTLHTTWEWIFQMGTEFGYGVDSSLRDEGQVFRAFGKVAVLIHAHAQDGIRPAREVAEGIANLQALGVERLLIFANASDHEIMFPYRAVAGELWTAPQGLGSIAYNLLTSTLVYLEYQDRVRWKLVNYKY
jgi:hypothetical protein